MRNKRILFICSANTDRSPTFHNWFAKHTDYEIKSCGIKYSSYDSIISEDLLAWADSVYVMDIGHYMYIDKHFHNYLDKVEIIGCSDQYTFEDPELISIVEYWAKMKEFDTHVEYMTDNLLGTENAKLSYEWTGENNEISTDEYSTENEAFEDLQKAVIYLGKLFDNHVMADDSKVIEATVKDMLNIE